VGLCFGACSDSGVVSSRPTITNGHNAGSTLALMAAAGKRAAFDSMLLRVPGYKIIRASLAVLRRLDAGPP
jgi:alpha-beta hydrolase superfamily lysophospholipase